jgi:hypothetical protein
MSIAVNIPSFGTATPTLQRSRTAIGRRTQQDEMSNPAKHRGLKHHREIRRAERRAMKRARKELHREERVAAPVENPVGPERGR